MTIKLYQDPKYPFREVFDTKTGFYEGNISYYEEGWYDG